MKTPEACAPDRRLDLGLAPRLAWLFEAAPPVADPPPVARVRLSRQGQCALGITLSLLALGLYVWVFRASQRQSQQLLFCQPGAALAAAPANPDPQTLSLINRFAVATPAQKMRLQQQTHQLGLQSHRLCELVRFDRSQVMGLMSVATTFFCLLCLVLCLSYSIRDNGNRTLQALQTSAAFLLAVPLVVLQLGEHDQSTKTYLLLYRDHNALLEQLQSAVANQELPAQGRLANTKIRDNRQVAELIRWIDAQKQEIPAINLELDPESDHQMFRFVSRLFGRN
jgi:hypothetical protein